MMTGILQLVLRPHEYYQLGDRIDDLESVSMVLRQEGFYEEAVVIDDAMDTIMELREVVRGTS